MTRGAGVVPPAESQGGVGSDRLVRVAGPLYGGDFYAEDGPGVHFPFVLRGELVEVSGRNELLRVVEASAERVEPRCPHFGACGGCQYQMSSAAEQLDTKLRVLRGCLREAGVEAPGEIAAISGEPYGYRNRIRLRVEAAEGGGFQLGYNRRGTTEFLPVRTCPIAAPLLWATAEALLAAAGESREMAAWMAAAGEVEFFCDDAEARVQVTLFCAPRTRLGGDTFVRAVQALQRWAPQVVGAGAVAWDARTGPTGRVLAEFGAAGLLYRVGEERYWVSRGGFFQVNRFLLEELVQSVCGGRSGALAWDLFAGVGLFSRVLARSFAAVTAVEGNPTAAADLRAALGKLGPQHRAVESAAVEFLRTAMTQRERPELLVLDPPRAGAGVEACALIGRLRVPEVVYVSCDPSTLARDLRVLTGVGYRVEGMTLVDLFPQTFHLETVVRLRLG